MIVPKPGEVYWVDLGLAAKHRPLMVVSREDIHSERALAVCVPLTTQIRGGKYEVSLPEVRWLPGGREGVANVLGITSVEHARLGRRAGQFDSKVLGNVETALQWMFDF